MRMTDLGLKVETLEDLAYLVSEKKCVINKTTEGFDIKQHVGFLRSHKPAAFVISMQGRLILNALRKGVYVYETTTNDR